MMPRITDSLRRLYEPLIVLLVVGAAGLIAYGFYRATDGGRKGSKVSFTAAFDDITGVKLRSAVLFKGIPVGTVRELAYDLENKKVLVRIDIEQPVDIPMAIKPFVKSSLLGDSHIALDTLPEEAGRPTGPLLTTVASHGDRKITDLYRIEGERLSQAEIAMPGIDAKIEHAMVEFNSLAARSKHAMQNVSENMDELVLNPIEECMQDLRNIIDGPEGEVDKGLKSELQRLLNELEGHSASLRTIFRGADGRHGLVELTDQFGRDWGKLKPTLESASKSLDNAGKAISASKPQIQKLGSAMERLGGASEEVKKVATILDRKPNALIFNISKTERDKIEQERTKRPAPPAGS